MMVSEWAKSYTTNVDFERHTQVIPERNRTVRSPWSTPYAGANCDTILAIMDDTTNNDEF
jgi:hypothetical protein